MYKMYNGLHQPTINNMYNKNSDIHNHNTRHKNCLHVSMAHSDLYAKIFYCSSILIDRHSLVEKIIIVFVSTLMFSVNA